MNKNLPTVVICCSEEKQSEPTRALDLYKGGFSAQVRSHAKRCGFDDAMDAFNVVILSAKYGFVGGDEVKGYYNLSMPEHEDIDAWIYSVRDTARVFNALNPEQPLMVFMTNDYLAVWDKMIEAGHINEKKLPKSTYVSRGHVGNLQLKSRLKKGLQVILENQNKPTYFRSGVASMAELGYLDAGQSIGTSLAHCNNNKMVHLKQELLKGAAEHKIFWDNGLITLLRQGKTIDTDWVFGQYKELITSAGANAKNIHIVIPDSPLCEQTALDIIYRHRTDIQWLMNRCNVILPVHNYIKPVEFADSALIMLDYPDNIRLGVPCLENQEIDLLLPLDTIEQLLQAKHNNLPLFNSIHFFGLSDVSAKNKLNPRLLLANMYLGHNEGFASLDACRTTALFGTGRKGTATQKQIEKEEAKVVEHTSVELSKVFRTEDDEDFTESDREHLEALDTFDKEEIEQYMLKFWDLLSDDEATEEVEAWFNIYNELVKEDGVTYQLEFDSSDSFESVYRAKQFVDTIHVQNLIEQRWYETFQKPKSAETVKVVHHIKLSPTVARRMAICKIFKELELAQAA